MFFLSQIDNFRLLVLFRVIMEQRGTTYWIHFAVRPKDNRRKIRFDCG